MLISPKEIITAVAAAAPEPGQPWQGSNIARRFAEMVQGKKEMEDLAYNAWKEGQKDWAVRYQAVEISPGNAQAVADWQQETINANFALCDQKISQNVTAINGVRMTLTGLASTYFSGGLTAPELAGNLLGIGTEIATLLNA